MNEPRRFSVCLPQGHAWEIITDQALAGLVGQETTVGGLVMDRFPTKVRIVAARRAYPERTVWVDFEEIDNGG